MTRYWYLVIFLNFTACLSHAGSLYDEKKYVPLVSDTVARNVGDNITVLIYETASASATENTDTSRSTDISGSVVGAAGQDGRALGLDSDFSGSGGVTRKGNLLASMTARIIDIDKNGELLIKGRQYIELNEDKQTITLFGRVRPSDIGPNNTVISTRISDAKISYLSEGTLADQQKLSWISRFFNWIF